MAIFNSYVKICEIARVYHPIVPLNHYKISLNPIKTPISISYVLKKRPPFGPFLTGLAPPDGLVWGEVQETGGAGWYAGHGGRGEEVPGEGRTLGWWHRWDRWDQRWKDEFRCHFDDVDAVFFQCTSCNMRIYENIMRTYENTWDNVLEDRWSIWIRPLWCHLRDGFNRWASRRSPVQPSWTGKRS